MMRWTHWLLLLLTGVWTGKRMHVSYVLKSPSWDLKTWNPWEDLTRRGYRRRGKAPSRGGTRFDPSTPDTEAGGSPSSRPAW